MDSYSTRSGRLIGYTMASAVEWAKAHPVEFAKQGVWWDAGDGEGPTTEVSADVRDDLTTDEEAAKSDVVVLREALALLAASHLRLTLETSARIEALEAKLERLADNPAREFA